MATGGKYRILCTKRKELVETIQRDPDNILDELLAPSITTEEEYNCINQKEDIVIKIRKLFIHMQKKGESTCQQFLKCLEIPFPGTNQNLQPSGHECFFCNDLLWLLLFDSSSCDVEAMAANEKPSEIIRKARRKLTAVLQTDPEAVLSVVDAHLLITEREYFTLSQINDPQKLIETLIETVLKKGELAHEQFLDCMENLQHTFPGLEPISEYVEDDPNNGTENPEAAMFSEKKNGPEDPEMVVSSVKKNLPESPEATEPSEKRNGPKNPEPNTSSEKGNRAESPEPNTSPEKGNGAESPEPNTSPEKGNGAESPEPNTSPEKGNRAESPETDTSPEKGNGAESPEPDTSPEKGNGAESPEVAISSAKGNRAESPEATASSGKGKKSEILEASATSEKGKGVKSPEVPPTLEKENSEEQLFLQTPNELLGPWSQRNMPESAAADDLLAARTIEKEPEGATPSRTPVKGTCDLEKSAGEKPSEIIRNKRKKLIEIFQKDLELILDELLSQSIVTEEEYNTLDKTEEDPKKKIRKLLILIQKKGESACQQFLECLEIVFPEEKADTLQVPELVEKDLPKDSLIQEQEVAIQQDPEQKQKDLPEGPASWLQIEKPLPDCLHVMT
ncbi:hypothetical protein KIL84_006515 [Mauremys mutica]|uniref:CARD domain-containing protein n=1 Tax=Mauremys mutica TaxID=74926 RepID=A0A9D3X1A5_9SAUR|nr:hypothetical protein KIL84_006515 [Mauremys mutica]